MNPTKRLIQKALIIGVIVIGIFLLVSSEWPEPPALSGLGFLMAGLAMWIPHCPIMRMLFGGDRS